MSSEKGKYASKGGVDSDTYCNVPAVTLKKKGGDDAEIFEDNICCKYMQDES